MAKDCFHPIVKAALIKEGWTVNHDPLELNLGGVDMEIDLGVEQVIGARDRAIVSLRTSRMSLPSNCAKLATPGYRSSDRLMVT